MDGEMPHPVKALLRVPECPGGVFFHGISECAALTGGENRASAQDFRVRKSPTENGRA
jgi:hypothetical protein